jgi:pyruvate/2-oxoglutarate dehydrogenase complex dihydrolipoamide acyltransferase (E2) component
MDDLNIGEEFVMGSDHDGREHELRVPDGVIPTSSTAIRVCLWLCSLGQKVQEGQRMIELIIGPMTFVVHAPCDGRLIRRCVVEGALVRPGALLGVIETDGRDTSSQS